MPDPALTWWIFGLVSVVLVARWSFQAGRRVGSPVDHLTPTPIETARPGLSDDKLEVLADLVKMGLPEAEVTALLWRTNEADPRELRAKVLRQIIT